MSTEPAMSAEPVTPAAEPRRRPGRPGGRPTRPPGVWLPRLFFDREIVEAAYALHQPAPRPDHSSPSFTSADPAATDLDSFAVALRGLPALEAQQLLEPYLEAAEPCPVDEWDRRRSKWPPHQPLPDGALRARAIARMLIESDIVLLWRRAGKARYTQTGFREWLGELPAHEFRGFLRKVVRGSEADDALARRAGGILRVREEDERRRDEDDWLGARERVMELIDCDEAGVALRVEDARERLTEFRRQHPGYINISPNQSWVDVERYMVDCRQFLERLGIRNEHLKTLVVEVFSELEIVKDWLLATASAIVRNGDDASPEQAQLMLEPPPDEGTSLPPESQDTAPPKSLKRKRAPDNAETSPSKSNLDKKESSPVLKKPRRSKLKDVNPPSSQTITGSQLQEARGFQQKKKTASSISTSSVVQSNGIVTKSTNITDIDPALTGDVVQLNTVSEDDTHSAYESAVQNSEISRPQDTLKPMDLSQTVVSPRLEVGKTSINGGIDDSAPRDAIVPNPGSNESSNRANGSASGSKISEGVKASPPRNDANISNGRSKSPVVNTQRSNAGLKASRPDAISKHSPDRSKNSPTASSRRSRSSSSSRSDASALSRKSSKSRASSRSGSSGSDSDSDGSRSNSSGGASRSRSRSSSGSSSRQRSAAARLSRESSGSATSSRISKRSNRQRSNSMASSSHGSSASGSVRSKRTSSPSSSRKSRASSKSGSPSASDSESDSSSSASGDAGSHSSGEVSTTSGADSDSESAASTSEATSKRSGSDSDSESESDRSASFHTANKSPSVPDPASKTNIVSKPSKSRKGKDLRELPASTAISTTTAPRTPRRKTRTTGSTSAFFSSPRTPSTPASANKFPPLSSQSFGIIQEELAPDPFQLIIAVTLLNKTRASVALPLFRTLIARWPTPAAISAASTEVLQAHLRPLGLQSRRTRTLLGLARDWLAAPPRRDARHRTRDYPFAGAGLGAYAWDSWRIFCRDVLRGVARGWDGEGAASGEVFEPEWKRVQPADKELRAFLRWMWLKEGLAWDPDTGEKVPVEN